MAMTATTIKKKKKKKKERSKKNHTRKNCKENAVKERWKRSNKIGIEFRCDG